MVIRVFNYDADFIDDMKLFLELIKRNKLIVSEAMLHKNKHQLFSIAVRRMILSYNKQHMTDKPLSESQIEDLQKEMRGNGS